MDEAAASLKDLVEKTHKKSAEVWFKAGVPSKSKWNKLKIVQHKSKLLQLYEGCRKQTSAHADIPALADLIMDDAEELIENSKDFHFEGITNIKAAGTVKRAHVKDIHYNSKVWCQRCSRIVNPEGDKEINALNQAIETDFFSFVGKLSDAGTHDASMNVFGRLSQISCTDDGH